MHISCTNLTTPNLKIVNRKNILVLLFKSKKQFFSDILLLFFFRVAIKRKIFYTYTIHITGYKKSKPQQYIIKKKSLIEIVKVHRPFIKAVTVYIA